jgi:hypothetical protein
MCRNYSLADSVQPAVDTFTLLASIEQAYKSVICCPQICATAHFESGVAEKLHSTTCVVGFAGLANGIIEHHRRGTADAQGGIKEALRRHILQPKDRFAPASRNMRRFLKTLCQYASEDSMALLEGLWREVISDLIVERCSHAPGQATTKLTFRNPTGPAVAQHPEARSDSLVDFLLTTLSEMRYISKMDMAVTKQCYMSADAAFVTAFRRLPKEVSLELTKAVVVRISSLIDSYKTMAMSRTWAEALDGITDLIQVMLVAADTL